MELREGEHILKVYHHHHTPFILDLLKIIVGAFPFFLLLYFFGSTMSTETYVIAHIVIISIFTLLIIYQSLIYWLDKLVVTNHRAIFIDWKFLTIRKEYEAELRDIQDIRTKERGVLAVFRFLDYGTFSIQTASHTSIIEFVDAPNPEGIRQFIYSIKPN